MVKALARGLVFVEKLDSKTTVDNKSTLAELGNECIMDLVGKRGAGCTTKR